MITFDEIKTKFKKGTIYYEADWGDCQEMEVIGNPMIMPKKSKTELDKIYWYARINGDKIVKNLVTELSKPYGLFWEKRASRIPDFSQGIPVWN